MKRKLGETYDNKNSVKSSGDNDNDNTNTNVVDYDQVIILNLCGTKFTLGRNTILSKPGTKLAKMISEGKLLVNHSDSIDSKQYYFDHNPHFFPLVQEWYCTGTFPLYKVAAENYDSLYDELSYWQISLSKTFESLKSDALSADIRPNVEKFVGMLVKSNLLSKQNYGERYYNLSLQNYPRDVIKTALEYKDGKENKPRLVKIVEYLDSRTILDLETKNVVERIANKYNLPLKVGSRLGPDISPFGKDNISLLLNRWKKIRDLHPILRLLYQYCFRYCLGQVKDVLKNKITDKCD